MTTIELTSAEIDFLNALLEQELSFAYSEDDPEDIAAVEKLKEKMKY